MFTRVLDDDRHLRLFEEADAAALYAVIEANREMLARWLPWAREETLQDAREFIRRSRRQVADDDGFQAAIVVGGTIAGAIGFNRVNRAHRGSEIGYWLARDAQGHGTMTLAAAALLDWAFGGPWRLNRVEIQAGTANAPSRAIPERLGFTHEGTRRAAEAIGDRFIDLEIYGLLAGEWRGVRTGAG